MPYSKQALENLAKAMSELDQFDSEFAQMEDVDILCGACTSCLLGPKGICIYFQIFFSHPYCRLHGAKA
jgi:hypothetical protein